MYLSLKRFNLCLIKLMWVLTSIIRCVTYRNKCAVKHWGQLEGCTGVQSSKEPLWTFCLSNQNYTKQFKTGHLRLILHRCSELLPFSFITLALVYVQLKLCWTIVSTWIYFHQFGTNKQILPIELEDVWLTACCGRRRPLPGRCLGDIDVVHSHVIVSE